MGTGGRYTRGLEQEALQGPIPNQSTGSLRSKHHRLTADDYEWKDGKKRRLPIDSMLGTEGLWSYRYGTTFPDTGTLLPWLFRIGGHEARSSRGK